MAKNDSAEKPKAKKVRVRRPEGSESLVGCFNNFLKAKKQESPDTKYKDLKKECSKEWEEYSDTQKLKYSPTKK